MDSESNHTRTARPRRSRGLSRFFFAPIVIMGAAVQANAQCPFDLIVPDVGAAGERLGMSVALDGDTAVLASADANAAYVMINSGGIWTEQAKLVADDPVVDPIYFGRCVAISGDTVVVGASSVGEPGAGIVYVFERTGTVWSKTAALSPSAVLADSGADFGNSVAIDGDTIVVGAHLDFRDIGAGVILTTGAAYVFEKPGETWSDMISGLKLSALDLESNDHFGSGVDIDGDRIVVGARENGDGPGAAYVYDKPGSTWTAMDTESAMLRADDEANGDEFGRRVAVSGDTVLVGAPYNDNSGEFDHGAAYVFTKSGGLWSQQEKLLTVNTNVSAGYFGYDVDLVGDTAIVGEWLVNHLAPSPYFLIIGGSAHKFSRTGATWTHDYEFAAFDIPNYTMSERVESLAFDGSTVIIGSPMHDWSATDCGAGFIFEGVDDDCNDNGVPDSCDIFHTTSLDEDLDGVPDECIACPADINGDDTVNVTDLLALLAAWGTAAGDTNDDGTTNVTDLLNLLAAWGECA